MSFDRLQYIDRLKEAGVEEPIARAHAEALRTALADTVATKSDLNQAVTAVRADLNEAVTAVRAELHEAVTAVRAEFHEAIQTLDRKIDDAVQILDRKIEITARDLTIKGAGGLVIIASLMIGLKLFG
jgi:ABC-type transporter Mla subunit MlaD